MSSNSEKMEKNEKVKIYLNLEPLGLKIGTVFKKTDTFQAVLHFVINQIKKIGIKYEIGRITEDKTGAILLTENIIGDFLEQNDEITIYSEDYGFIRNNLPGGNEHNSSKKIYYLKNVSNLYKSMNFLKKKRNDKQKNKNQPKKDEKKADESDEGNNEIIKLEEENEEKEKKKNANLDKKENKKESTNKKENTSKKESKKDKDNNNTNSNKNKSEKKEKKDDEKEKSNRKTSKSIEKPKKVALSDSDDDEDEEKKD